MENLPPEILSMIINYQDAPLALYSTISCDWQSSILGLVLRSLPVVEKIHWSLFGPEVRLLDLRRDIRTCELS